MTTESFWAVFAVVFFLAVKDANEVDHRELESSPPNLASAHRTRWHPAKSRMLYSRVRSWPRSLYDSAATAGVCVVRR
jgi:hypothetical protein